MMVPMEYNESEARFRGLFEQAPFSVQLVGIDGRTIAVNPAYMKLWGCTQEILENHIMKHSFLEDKALEESGHLEYIRRGIAGEVVQVPPFLYEPLKVGLPGKARWCGGTIFPLKDVTGKVREIVIIHQDVTDQYDLNAERDRLISEAQEAVNKRDEFITIASHELRTPISSLSLQIEVLSHVIGDGTTVDADHAHKVIGHAKRQLDRLTRLLDDMLGTSGAAIGKLSFELQRVEIGELVRTVLDRFTSQLESMQIELHLKIEGPVFLMCDPLRMDQVLTNLMTNAIRYGNFQPIHVHVLGVRDRCLISIRDEGKGIAPADQERIFHRFERLGGEGDGVGLGLGLYINRQIVEQHGGKISIASEVGKGSTFTVVMPRVD